MLPILNIGPLAIQTPGLILLLGVWLGLTLSEKAARRSHYEPDKLYTLVLLALAAGLIGARLSYAAQNIAAFRSNAWGLLNLTPQMLDPLGGILFAIFGALIFGQRKGLSLWPTLDVLTPGLAVFMIAIGFANLASGNAFGAPADLPWSISLWGDMRHPTQIYQILLAGLVAWFMRPGGSLQFSQPGIRFLVFLSATALAHIVIETFRGDSRTLLANIRTNQVIAWVILAVAIWFIQHRITAGILTQKSTDGEQTS